MTYLYQILSVCICYLRLSFSFRSVFIYIRQLRLHANDSNTVTLRSPFKIKAQFGS